MKRLTFMVVFPLIVSVTCFFLGDLTCAAIYFDDSDPNIMVLGNSAYYEIGFRKSNGSIAYVTDKSTGQHVTLGSRNECLWGAVFPNGTPEYVGGCGYNATWPNLFSYSWLSATRTLTLNYMPDSEASQQVTAHVTVIASEESWFDLSLLLHNNWGYVLDWVLFPSDLVFIESDIEEALLPLLPGVILKPAFFDQNRSYVTKYPGGGGVFADYVSLSSTKGQIAIYSLYEQGPVKPVFLGFVHDDDYVSDSTRYYHVFGGGISNDETWISPSVRIRISQSPMETIRAYRTDNGLDRFRSLLEKLGSRYTQITQSPVLKADAYQVGIPYSEYLALLAQLPSPAILHPVGFQPRGHDENYPDFLPIDPIWGTTDDFVAMFQQAHALGLLVMPYTNPTWWDDESPTLRNLPSPLTITDVAVLDDQGVPLYEYYGGKGGYVMSPYAPFVQHRLDQLIQQMTVDVPSDLLFEDQIGARPWLFDYNPSSPYPTAEIQGWLVHTGTYSNILLMTEAGWDRLVETEVGFHGGVVWPEHYDEPDSSWGTDAWRLYPLGPLMARDKVLFYQHNLAGEVSTWNKATFTWNLAFGYMLNYDLSYGLQNPWLNTVGVFQKHVVSRYAGETMVNFADLEDRVTQTSFETFTVIANWDKENVYEKGEHKLPPLGVLVSNADGTLTAGVFISYNGVALSHGEHFLIEERGLTEIAVRQPLGADTNLTLKQLPNWNVRDRFEAWAYSATGQPIGSVPVTLAVQNITFFYQQEMAGQPVAYYKVGNIRYH
jgi:hypothetical protein